MCLLFFALDQHPRYPLIVAANRDEFYSRPAAPVQFWQERPGLLAGRDLDQGGTWLGITTEGRWAALTNFREGEAVAGRSRSRGHLVGDFLTGTLSALEYAATISPRAGDYAGFNLVVGDGAETVYTSNRTAPASSLPAGCYGLSNHLLDTPWPKVVEGKAALANCLYDGVDVDGLFALLSPQQVVDDRSLPDTGVGIGMERLLSSAFIAGEHYGTRCATVILLGADGRLYVEERTFEPDQSGIRRPSHYRSVAFETGGRGRTPPANAAPQATIIECGTPSERGN